MKKAISGNLVKFTFDDNVAPYTFDTTRCSGAVRAYAIPFAFMHRLGDAAALSRVNKDGTVRTITEAMRRDVVAELGDHYLTGTDAWEMRASGRIVRNAIWEQIAAKRGVDYDVIAAEMAQRDLDALAAA